MMRKIGTIYFLINHPQKIGLHCGKSGLLLVRSALAKDKNDDAISNW